MYPVGKEKLICIILKIPEKNLNKIKLKENIIEEARLLHRDDMPLTKIFRDFIRQVVTCVSCVVHFFNFFVLFGNCLRFTFN